MRSLSKTSYLTLILINFFLITSCVQSGNRPNSMQVNSFLKKLSDFPGAYAWNKHIQKTDFSKRVELEEILNKEDRESLVKALIDCMDNSELSNTILNQEKVPLGIVCYEALSQTVYYEPTDKNGDIAPNWSGLIEPTKATLEDLTRAKQAWLKVYSKKLYIFQ